MASASWKTVGLPKCKEHDISEEVLITWIPDWNWNKSRHIISIAVYVPYHWVTYEDMGWNLEDDYYEHDYCEEDDDYYIDSGWYETIQNSIEDCNYVKIEGEVIAWDKLPKAYEPESKLHDVSKLEVMK